MHLLARIRLTVARHPWAYWLAISVVAGAVALGTARAVAGVEAQRRSWGEQQTVWVAKAAIEPGQPIRADRQQVPRAVVPPGAVLVAPVDVVARQRIGAGETINAVDLAASGSAALIPDGWVAFAVAASVDHFAPGDHLRVYSGDRFVATGVVVDHDESELMVAIPVEAAPAMATGLLADSVTIALTAGP